MSSPRRATLTFQAAALFLGSLLPLLIAVGWVNYNYTRTALEEQSRRDLIARTQASQQTLANIFLRELERLTTLARQPDLSVGLAGQPDPAAQAAYEHATSADPIRIAYVATPVGSLLKEFREQFPNRAVVLLTNPQGDLIGVTSPAWPYWKQADQLWWPRQPLTGTDALSIGAPTDIPGFGRLLPLTAPVRDNQNRVVGIVMVGLKLGVLTAALQDDTAATTTLLATHDGTLLSAAPGTPPRLSPAWQPTYQAIGPGAALLAEPPGSSATGAQLVGYAPLQQVEGYSLNDPASIRALNRLDWVVIRLTPTAQAFASLGPQLTLLAAGTLITMLLILILAMITVRQLVTRPLKQLTTVMDDVRLNGLHPSLVAQVPQRLPHNHNEIGQLAQTFVQLLQNLSALTTEREQVYTQQQAAVTRLRGMAQRLSTAAAEQQHIAAQTNSMLTQVVVAYTALDQAANSIADHAQQVADQAAALKDQHQAGAAAVVQTQQALTDLQETAQGLEKGARTLAQNASQVGTLIGEVYQVAGTTHILSLNATIEAADAGPYGLRFGVIAEEVRTLADAAAHTATEVEEQLASIGVQTRLTATGTSQARLAVDQGAGQIQVLRGTLQTLSSAAETLAQSAESIRQGSAAQRHQSREVYEISHQLASAMEQVVRASHEVTDQAQELLALAGLLADASQAEPARLAPVGWGLGLNTPVSMGR